MIFEVGKCYPEFKGTGGLFLNIDGSGVTVLCRMEKPTREEIDAFKVDSPIRIDMGLTGCVVFWVMSFKGIDAMDCTYSPKIARMPPSLLDPGRDYGYSCLIMLADASDGKLLQNRLVSLPNPFSRRLKNYVEMAMACEDRSYSECINTIYSFSTNKLKKMTTSTALIV